jgi:cell division cycle 14
LEGKSGFISTIFIIFCFNKIRVHANVMPPKDDLPPSFFPITHPRKSVSDVTICLSQHGGFPLGSPYVTFEMEGFTLYDKYCSDFGPMNMLSVIRFVNCIDKQMNEMALNGIKYLVCCTSEGKESFTNAAFLLGAHMILKLEYRAVAVSNCFQFIDPSVFEGYRDASEGVADFRLSLLDCWRGLERGKELGWIRIPRLKAPFRWGMIDADAYDHYDNPINADLHVVVPGELIIFRGPKDLDGVTHRDNVRDGSFVSRDLSPDYCADLLKDLGVSTVVRVNRPHYDAAAFVSRGFEHIDLDFEGASIPPPRAVARFFRVMDGARGLVAIHGRESLGRAGTLAALHMMRSHGFGAREAMAWLRVMRPGSVLGGQQQYLVHVERSCHSVLASIAASSSSAESAQRPPGPPRHAKSPRAVRQQPRGRSLRGEGGQAPAPAREPGVAQASLAMGRGLKGGPCAGASGLPLAVAS